jgi:hypothetical protein
MLRQGTLRSTVPAQVAVHIGARDHRAAATTGIGKKLNGHGLRGDRARRAAETVEQF